MNRKTRCAYVAAAAATAAGMLMLGVTSPVSAATGDTSATVTITGGALQISVPVSAGSLGSRANTITGGTISGTLGVVQVVDARSAVAGSGWVASVISTAFTPTTGSTIGAANVSYTAGAITKTGTAVYIANDPVGLTAASAAVTATGITGDNSATWSPMIHVAVAGGTIAGTYAAVITHSVV